MRPILVATLIGMAAFAQPAQAQTQTQTPGIGQALQGLLSGNQGQDQTVRDAYERGYQRGRDDEARRGSGNRSERRSSRSSSSDDENNDRRR